MFEAQQRGGRDLARAPSHLIAWAALVALALAIAVPFFGWAGLQTEGAAIALLGAVVLVAAPPHTSRRLSAAIAAGLGAVGVTLLIIRLSAEPTNPIPAAQVLLRLALSKGWVALALAGAATVVVVALWQLPSGGAVGREFVVSRLDADQRAAWRSAAVSLVSSRSLVWIAGILAVSLWGVHRDVAGILLERPFGGLGNVLVAPATSWDAGSYLAIAEHGYAGGLYFDAYFPLYPILIRLAAWSPGAAVLAGIVISLVSFLIGLYLLHRLVRLDFSERIARLTVLLVAFFPMALFFSAVYTESLYLAVSVGAIYAARTGHWRRAGLLGAAAVAARSNGLVVLVPLVVLYFYGPRADHLPRGAGWRPRYAVDRQLGYLLLVPLPLLLYLAYMGFHGDWLAPMHAEQAYWGRYFVPLEGVWHGLRDAIRSVHQLWVGHSQRILVTYSPGELTDPVKLAVANLTDFAFLLLAIVTLAGAVRRLPMAYWSYALVSIVVPLSVAEPIEPLASFPRYLAVVFPCQLVLALWIERRGWRRVLVPVSAGLMVLFAAQFARGLWVA